MVVHYRKKKKKSFEIKKAEHPCNVQLYCLHLNRQVIKLLEAINVITVEQLMDPFEENRIAQALGNCRHSNQVWNLKKQISERVSVEHNNETKFKGFSLFAEEERNIAILYSVLFPLLKKETVQTVKTTLLPATILFNPKKLQLLPAA